MTKNFTFQRVFFLLLCFALPVVAQAQSVVEVSGAITENTTWQADKTYLLKGYVYVKKGYTLTIQPGTVIKGDKATKGTLIIARGAKIIADGKRNQPIVFTSNEPQPAPEDWGGLVVCGYAPANGVGSGVSCMGVAEGGINTTEGDALYGSGDQPGGCGFTDDNSGILRFVRIEYGGIPFQFGNETNGLTLAGVGSGTIVDYVQVSFSGDDGFEWFGGTVNCKHLISYSNRDDDFDCDNGYRGNVQFGLIVRNPTIADMSGSNGLEIDNDNAGTPATPKTRPTFSNITVIGPTGGNINPNYRRAAHLRRNSEAGIFNSMLIGNFPVGVFVDGVSTIANAQNNLLEVKGTRVADAPELLKTTEQTFNISQWFSNADWNNATAATSAAYGLVNPFNLGDPNAQPNAGSIATSGSTFSSARLDNPFFEEVPYIGAFSPAEDWSCGWAKFEVLNTNCVSATSDATQMIPELQLRPNVANTSTILQLTLAESANLSVDIFDLNGQLQSQPVRERASAGEQSYELSTATLASGFYIVRITAGTAVRTEKLIVLKQ